MGTTHRHRISARRRIRARRRAGRTGPQSVHRCPTRPNPHILHPRTSQPRFQRGRPPIFGPRPELRNQRPRLDVLLRTTRLQKHPTLLVHSRRIHRRLEQRAHRIRDHPAIRQSQRRKNPIRQRRIPLPRTRRWRLTRRPQRQRSRPHQRMGNYHPTRHLTIFRRRAIPNPTRQPIHRRSRNTRRNMGVRPTQPMAHDLRPRNRPSMDRRCRAELPRRNQRHQHQDRWRHKLRMGHDGRNRMFPPAPRLQPDRHDTTHRRLPATLRTLLRNRRTRIPRQSNPKPHRQHTSTPTTAKAKSE